MTKASADSLLIILKELEAALREGASFICSAFLRTKRAGRKPARTVVPEAGLECFRFPLPSFAEKEARFFHIREEGRWEGEK